MILVAMQNGLTFTEGDSFILIKIHKTPNQGGTGGGKNLACAAFSIHVAAYALRKGTFSSLHRSAVWASSSLRWEDYIRKLSVSLKTITDSLLFQLK